ncbi:hypothetical protein BX666DRAFT_2126249 [Dichotomocladium elegans]|nr:hypothetical protein BX666DRAFT_2126249 [Dichotomocladium elegans]
MPRNLIQEAAELLRESFVDDVYDYDADCPAVIEMGWGSFQTFVNEEEKRTGCTFYNETTGGTRNSNKKFLQRLGETPNEDVSDATSIASGVKRGRPSGNSFTLIFKCHRHKKPKASGSSNRAHENLPCGCTATIKAVRYISDPAMVTVTYNWRHTGHVPRSRQDFATAPNSRDVRETLTHLVESGLTWKSIQQMVNLDRSVLERILSHQDSQQMNVIGDAMPLTNGFPEAVPRSLRITY